MDPTSYNMLHCLSWYPWQDGLVGWVLVRDDKNRAMLEFWDEPKKSRALSRAAQQPLVVVVFKYIPKTTMEPQTGGLEDDFPFSKGWFSGSMLVFGVVFLYPYPYIGKWSSLRMFEEHIFSDGLRPPTRQHLSAGCRRCVLFRPHQQSRFLRTTGGCPSRGEGHHIIFLTQRISRDVKTDRDWRSKSTSSSVNTHRSLFWRVPASWSLG